MCLQCGRPGFNPWVGKIPWRGKGYPLQYSGLENSMDCIVSGFTKSWTQLSDFHFHFSPFIKELVKVLLFLYGRDISTNGSLLTNLMYSFRASALSADSLWSLVQNNPYSKEAYFGWHILVSLTAPFLQQKPSSVFILLRELDVELLTQRHILMRH